MKISLPVSNRIADSALLALLRSDADRTPETRIRAAALLTKRADHDEALDELSGIAPSQRTFASAFVLVRILSNRNEDGDAVEICAVAEQWPGETGDERAQMLVQLGRALKRLGDKEAASEALWQALALRPGDGAALRGLMPRAIEAGRIEPLLAHCEALLARGVITTRIIYTASMLMALAGRADEAKALAGFDEFFGDIELAPPPGFASLAEFNALLASEIRSSPDLYYSGERKPGLRMWRVENLPLRRGRALRALLEAFRDAALDHAGGLKPGPHPFLQSRPDHAEVNSWCGITRAEGFEAWHIHDQAWLSGVYYAAVPDCVASGTGDGGKIRFGWPPDRLGQQLADRMGERSLTPRAGRLLLFPSAVSHATSPHGDADNDRIAISFDLIPVKGAEPA